MVNMNPIIMPLNRPTTYASHYNPDLLCPIPRTQQRDKLGLGKKLPFTGHDNWTAYEISCLNPQGKPLIAIGQIRYACDSLYLIESKSFKLYLNSFNMTQFENLQAVQNKICDDLSHALNIIVDVQLYPPAEFKPQRQPHFKALCLDNLDMHCKDYQPNPSLLHCQANSPIQYEAVYSDLLKSNCLVTGQPDWGSVYINYTGPAIDHEGLLKYIISLREHNEFHEHCVERIFCDILSRCQPTQLTVYARYTRRGGLDINPYRSTQNSELAMLDCYLPRQ